MFVSIRYRFFFSFLYYSFTFKYLLQFDQFFFFSRLCTAVLHLNICYNLFNFFFLHCSFSFCSVLQKLLQFFRFCNTFVTIFRFCSVLQKKKLFQFFSFLYYICYSFCIASVCFTDSFRKYVLFLSFRNGFAFDSG